MLILKRLSGPLSVARDAIAQQRRAKTRLSNRSCPSSLMFSRLPPLAPVCSLLQWPVVGLLRTVVLWGPVSCLHELADSNSEVP